MDFPAHTCPEVRTLYEHSENILFRLRHFTEIISENYLNLCHNIRIVHYSLSDGGGWSKMKVSFSVSIWHRSLKFRKNIFYISSKVRPFDM